MQLVYHRHLSWFQEALAIGLLMAAMEVTSEPRAASPPDPRAALVSPSLPLSLPFQLVQPTFIKIGQQFSTRVDVLAPEFVKELEKLQVGIRGIGEVVEIEGMCARECIGEFRKGKGSSSRRAAATRKWLAWPSGWWWAWLGSSRSFQLCCEGKHAGGIRGEKTAAGARADGSRAVGAGRGWAPARVQGVGCMRFGGGDVRTPKQAVSKDHRRAVAKGWEGVAAVGSSSDWESVRNGKFAEMGGSRYGSGSHSVRAAAAAAAWSTAPKTTIWNHRPFRPTLLLTNPRCSSLLPPAPRTTCPPLAGFRV